MFKLNVFLATLLLICQILVFLSPNPVYSVLFLILAFLSAAVIIFLFKVDFLSLIYVIVYVGAIAILFLFVVMMLSVKYVAPKVDLTYLVYFVLFFIFSLNSVQFMSNLISNSNVNLTDRIDIIDYIANIELLGQITYNYYCTAVLLAGLVLLVALVGAISLTQTNYKK